MRFTLLICMFLLCATSMLAQSSSQEGNDNLKLYAAGGVVFDYPAEWQLNDQSTQDAQQIVLTSKALDAQVMIVAPKQRIETKEHAEAARQTVIDPTVVRTVKQYQDAGIKVLQSPAEAIEIGGAKADGVVLQFVADGRPANTYIYWPVLNKRLVLLFFTRPYENAAKAAACWDTIRNSLKVEGSSER